MEGVCAQRVVGTRKLAALFQQNKKKLLWRGLTLVPDLVVLPLPHFEAAPKTNDVVGTTFTRLNCFLFLRPWLPTRT
jgi:hypothetical protein